MVKALSLISSAIFRVRTLLAALGSALHAILPAQESKMGVPMVTKKRKIIAKKDVRLLVRRKLQAKRMGNSSGAAIDDCDSSADPQTRSLSAIALTSAGEIDARFAVYLGSNDEQLTCSVCRSLMQLPTATTCSHVFCLQCIENSLVVSNRCPLCRAAVAGEDNYGIHSLRPVERLLQVRRNRQEETEEQRKRVEDHQAWRRNRFVEEEELVAGAKVDVWKTDAREWKKAQVVLRDQETLMVAFHNHTREQNEIIELPSLRLAREGFYSSRYQADEFSFPDLHFRNSVRLGSEMQFSILPFRRSLHLRLAAPYLPSVPREPLPVRISRFFNPIRADPPVPELPAEEPEPEELGQLDVLSPQEMQLPEGREGDVNELLPNLNPESEFRRQAESSSSEEEQQQELFPFIDHLEGDF